MEDIYTQKMNKANIKKKKKERKFQLKHIKQWDMQYRNKWHDGE